MFILKSLTNDDDRVGCDITPFENWEDALGQMRKEYDKVRDSYGIEDGISGVTETATFEVNDSCAFAEVNSGLNDYRWEILEFKNYIPRYSVRGMSDAFPDPEDVYCIWDNINDKYCVDCDGTALTFREIWQAQEFIDKYYDKIFI